MKNILFLLILTIGIYGCSREVPCNDTDIELGFIGFDKSELDTLIIRKYMANDNYQHLVDTLIYPSDTSGLNQSHDTIRIRPAYDLIKYGNDWQIFIPAKNKTILISDIKSEQKEIKCHFTFTKSNCYCINPIYSVKLDNTLIDLSGVNTALQPYYIYIH
ncbi:MAG: hypothetical protein M3015_14315 [Bacteroidota bacterium]|nr:hypothetical protein [Bacteroidota bacterium]